MLASLRAAAKVSEAALARTVPAGTAAERSAGMAAAASAPPLSWKCHF